MVETILILSIISVGLSLITLVLVLTKLRRPDAVGRQDGEELLRTKDELKEYVGMTARMQTDNVRNLFVGFSEAISAQTQAQKNGIDITDKRIEALTRTVSETLNSFRVEMQRTLGEIRQENT